MKLIKMGALCAPLIVLAGCAKHVTYNPSDFVNPNKVVVKNIAATTPAKIDATFAMGNDPAVVKAYQLYANKGVAQNLVSPGFKTFAYDAHKRSIITCAPLHLCIVQLELGETINNIDLGDSADWMVSTALVGTKTAGSYQVAVKPKLYDIATDMVITTNKRTYNIGLLSQKGQTTHVASFYYPQETLDAVNNQLSQQDQSITQNKVSNATLTNLNHLNFNYVLKGGDVAWAPTRVFDDGDKTFIQMPVVSEELNLPVLYILCNKQLALVTYRYKKPYYIVDGLFSKAFLISGKGSDQQRLEIDNKNFS